MYREQDIKSGKMFEALFYPIRYDGIKISEYSIRNKKSLEDYKKQNEENAKRYIVRLVNANFDENDIFMHPTYADGYAPQTEKQARRDISNYFRRVRRWRKKHGLSELKYIYVLERTVNKKIGRVNWHFHIFMSGMDRDIAEKMWRKGIKVNANRFQPEQFGQEAAARYIAKAYSKDESKGKRKWSSSTNLKKPDYRPPKDGKVKRRGIERMATLHKDDAKYWERRYKGYRFISCEPKWNEYNSHWYIRVTMRKNQ